MFLVNEFDLDHHQVRALREAGEVCLDDDFAVGVTHAAPSTVEQETAWRRKARLPQHDPQVIDATE